jgi:hypothetical protein
MLLQAHHCLLGKLSIHLLQDHIVWFQRWHVQACVSRVLDEDEPEYNTGKVFRSSCSSQWRAKASHFSLQYQEFSAQCSYLIRVVVSWVQNCAHCTKSRSTAGSILVKHTPRFLANANLCFKKQRFQLLLQVRFRSKKSLSSRSWQAIQVSTCEWFLWLV